MYLMYIDESGDTSQISDGGSRFLVLTGCIFDEEQKLQAELQLRAIKHKYYQNSDVEFKSNFLRYANPAITAAHYTSPIKMSDKGRYEAMQSELKRMLKALHVALIVVVVAKEHYWSLNPSQSPYRAAYSFLLERFQQYLEKRNDAKGICIIDPREGQVLNKKDVDKELQDAHDALRWGINSLWRHCSNVIEKVLFSESNLTVGIQIADLFCYPTFHMYEYDKKLGEYEWFDTITAPKVVNHLVFPKDTKKGFWPRRLKS